MISSAILPGIVRNYVLTKPILEMYTMYEFELMNYVNINYLKLFIILRKLKVIAQVDFQISLT